MALLAFVLFAMNSYCVWNWGDDYLIKVRFQSITPIKFLINDYWKFDGRSLNLGYLISRNCLATPWPWLATVIASAFYLASAHLLTNLMHNQSPLKSLERFVLTIFFTAILWLAGFYTHSETLYWQTGMLYVVELFLFYLSYVYLHSKNVNILVLFFLSFIAGIASPGAVIAVLVALVIEYLYLKDREQKRHRAIAIIGFSIGLSIVLLSPGSISRFQAEGGVDKSYSYIHELYFRLHQFMDKFFALNTPMLWLMILAGIFMLLLSRSKEKTKISILRRLYDFRWLLAAAISLMFYLPRMLYYITSPRLNIHPVFLVMLFFAVQLTVFRKENPEAYQRWISSFQMPVLLTFIVMAFYQYWGASFCVKKMANRIQLYKDNKGKDLVLKANDLIGPPATREFIDITDDSAYALNVAVAKHFGLKSIKKEKYR